MLRVHGKFSSHVFLLSLPTGSGIPLHYFITYKYIYSYFTDCVHSVFKNRYESIIYPVDGSLVDSIPSPSFSLFFILCIYLAHCMVPGCVEYTHADLLSSYLQSTKFQLRRLKSGRFKGSKENLSFCMYNDTGTV